MTRTTDLRTIHSEEYHILLAKLQESVRDIVQTLKLLEDVSNASSALVDYEDKVVRDIEHLLEFEKLPVGSYAKLSSEIRQSRQRRRKHVNIVTAIKGINSFGGLSPSVIKELKTILNYKAHCETDNTSYTYRVLNPHTLVLRSFESLNKPKKLKA